MSFWHSGAGLSFVAFNLDLCRAFNDVCDGELSVAAGGAASDVFSNGKTRYGPFVSFRNVFKFSKGIFEDCKIFENFKRYENYKVYEGSVVL